MEPDVLPVHHPPVQPPDGLPCWDDQTGTDVPQDAPPDALLAQLPDVHPCWDDQTAAPQERRLQSQER